MCVRVANASRSFLSIDLDELLVDLPRLPLVLIERAKLRVEGEAGDQDQAGGEAGRARVRLWLGE